MLSMSDIDIQQFIPLFADLGISVAFLVPTPTGYNKSIMDATSSVRDFLKYEHIHDYTTQGQGQENKVIVKSFFVNPSGLQDSEASLYRPITKHGDPRIWFSNLKRYCLPCNLLALVTMNRAIYVINLSNEQIRESIYNKAYVYDLFKEIAHKDAAISDELRQKIQAIHNMGFLPSITPGDPGVGDTLEHALGISRNNKKAPDYKGIELKASRLTRNGHARKSTRSNLFSKVPDEGMTYRQIVKQYGKVQTPHDQQIARLQLYETLRCSRANAYDLELYMDTNNDKLDIMYVPAPNTKSFVSAWYMQSLRDYLLIKHHETFWVQAVSKTQEGKEYFRYDKIMHTKNPNASLFVPLLESDKITVDIAGHFDPDTNKFRNHGMLFKMDPDDIPLLLGTPAIYDLKIE